MFRVLTPVLLAVLALPFAADDKKDDGWIALFNGKDLTGWKVHPDDKAKWEVQDSILTGTGESGTLFSEKGDYDNFYYRVEARINDHGNSGQFFRTAFGKALRRRVTRRRSTAPTLTPSRPAASGAMVRRRPSRRSWFRPASGSPRK